MLSVVEKVIFLQTVDVFTDVPTEDLAYIGAITQEVSYLKDDTIYKVNDPSDALYLVRDGRVRLHRDQQEINVAGPREAFGVWALFDEEPRVADATALEETQLLRIGRDDFYALLADHVRITQGVFKRLVHRLRSLARVSDVDIDPKNMER